jgi:hypothetical protein
MGVLIMCEERGAEHVASSSMCEEEAPLLLSLLFFLHTSISQWNALFAQLADLGPSPSRVCRFLFGCVDRTPGIPMALRSSTVEPELLPEGTASSAPRSHNTPVVHLNPVRTALSLSPSRSEALCAY